MYATAPQNHGVYQREYELIAPVPPANGHMVKSDGDCEQRGSQEGVEQEVKEPGQGMNSE